MANDPNDAELSTNQAAQLAKLSPGRIRQLCASGELGYRATPLGRLIDADSVRQFVTKRAEAAKK